MENFSTQDLENIANRFFKFYQKISSLLFFQLPQV